MDNDRYMTGHEACGCMEISIGLLNRLDKEGLLKTARRFMESGKRLYLFSDVNAYIESIMQNNSEGV